LERDFVFFLFTYAFKPKGIPCLKSRKAENVNLNEAD